GLSIASAEKRTLVYLHQLRDWYQQLASDDSDRASQYADADNEVHQEMALSYLEIKAGLGENAQAWAAVTGPMGFSRNRKFLADARKALVKEKFVRHAAELPLPQE